MIVSIPKLPKLNVRNGISVLLTFFTVTMISIGDDVDSIQVFLVCLFERKKRTKISHHPIVNRCRKIDKVHEMSFKMIGQLKLIKKKLLSQDIQRRRKCIKMKSKILSYLLLTSFAFLYETD